LEIFNSSNHCSKKYLFWTFLVCLTTRMVSGIATKQKCRSAYYFVYMCSTNGTYSTLDKYTVYTINAPRCTVYQQGCEYPRPQPKGKTLIQHLFIFKTHTFSSQNVECRNTIKEKNLKSAHPAIFFILLIHPKIQSR